MTFKEYNDIRRTEPEKAKGRLDVSKWIYHLEESISRVRRKINQITVLIKWKTEKEFTPHEKPLLNKFFKNYGNTKMTTHEFNCTMLKQDLKSKTQKLKYQKEITECKKINKLFHKDPKKVYRTIKGQPSLPKVFHLNKMLRRFGKVYGTIL